MIILGMTVADRITGFRGVVTGLVKYITGCNQALVVPPLDKDGKVQDSTWFDEQRLQQVAGTDVLQLDNTLGNGPDRAPPKR